MKITQLKLLYSLFFKSSNLMLKLSLMFLPIIMAVSLASIFFINNLSGSYKDYLLKSYIGTQGVLNIKSENIEYLKALQTALKKKSIDSSLKKELRRDVIFKTQDYLLEKKVKFVVLQKEYMKEKLHYNQEAIVINNILKNIFGDISKLSLKQVKQKTFTHLHTLKTIDTGFLSTEPLVFIGRDFFEKLGFHFKVYDSLELSITLDQIDFCLSIAKELADEYETGFNYVDILSQHKETELLFQNISYIELIVLIITSILSLIILTGSLTIISQIKQKAITLLRIYGLSTQLISLGLTLLSVILLSISLLIAYVLFVFMKLYFIMTLNFDYNFFIPLNTNIIYIVGSILLVFICITYLWAFQTFKGKITI